MAKKSAIEKNNRRRRLAKQFSAKRAQLKATSPTRTWATRSVSRARLKLAELPRNSSPTRIRNRCEMTGRPRGYYRKLKMSRIALRDHGQ